MNKTMRILFVDDDELLLACFQRMLGRRFDLDVAASGKQALEALAARGPYAVVVSDLRMPGMNGIELLSRIKQVHPHTVAILLSGNASSDETDAAVHDGTLSRLVQKPCPNEEMIQILKESIAQYEIAKSADAPLPTVLGPIQAA